jgi:hypothetical protein
MADDARRTVALANSNGDLNSPVTVAVFKEIFDALEWEKSQGKSLSPLEIFRGKVTRRRVMIGASPGVLTSSTGQQSLPHQQAQWLTVRKHYC